MSVNDTERDSLPIDPPDNQGGGSASATSLDSETTTETAPIDPPDNQGGGGAA
jgi:hypothetical protein